VQIKQAGPVKEEVIKGFCTEPYYNFLSKPRSVAQWDSLERVVREGNADSHPEAAELESCGIMVRPPLCTCSVIKAIIWNLAAFRWRGLRCCVVHSSHIPTANHLLWGWLQCCEKC
jgi:hypothetical protein